MDPVSTVALGIELSLVPTVEGGRRRALRGGWAPEARFAYEPNWGLPGWPDGQQTAAPVLDFSAVSIVPGSSVRAVIVPVFIEEFPAWRQVTVGDTLRMYEGPRICGTGLVAWVDSTLWPTPVDEQDRLVAWLGA